MTVDPFSTHAVRSAYDATADDIRARYQPTPPSMQQHTPEPVPLDLGHVAHQAVQRQLRGSHRPMLATRIVEPLAFQ
jgi:hypothetical protein